MANARRFVVVIVVGPCVCDVCVCVQTITLPPPKQTSGVLQKSNCGIMKEWLFCCTPVSFFLSFFSMFFSKHLLQSHEHVTQLAVLRYLEGKDVGHKPHTKNGVGGGGGSSFVELEESERKIWRFVRQGASRPLDP